MGKGKGIAEESDEKEANNSMMASAVVREDIVNLLDFIEIILNENQLLAPDKKDNFEILQVNLTILLRFVQFLYPNLDHLKATVPRQSYDFWSRRDIDRVLGRILDYIESCICSEHHFESMTEEKLVELLDSTLVKLHHLSGVAQLDFPLMTQYKNLQNVWCIVRDFYGLKINACVELEIVEYTLPQIQLMAERVGHFCWVLLGQQIDLFVESEDHDLPRVDVTLANLLEKMIPVGLEVIHISFTNLKASNEVQVEHFIKQLIRISPNILKESLIHLQNHMVNVTSSSTSARKLYVVIEFLLLILTDMHKNFIYLDKLFDLLARVEVITKEVSIIVRRFDDKLRDEESTIEIMYLLENIELLKRDVKHVYLKAPDPVELCFPMSDGPLFVNLLLIKLTYLLNSNALSVALIKEEIELVKEDLDFIKYFFGNVEQELHKDLRKHALNVAYEVKYVINSILAREDGLLHIMFSLPTAIGKIKLIKEDVSDLQEKIPKDRVLIVHYPKRSIKNKSLADGRIFVGFKEERDWIIRKLTSGPAELDVISIIGMPGLGKTTLAYKVYNDRAIVNHFDICAWCTVDQVYDRKMILQKILNQITGSNEEIKEDTDVDDMLRKKLYGRRYLIVLDDLWDTESWDDLTRPFPQVKKGSRIMLTSRKQEVASWGKCCSDPLNLQPLKLEESWELLEKRVFQEESCPAELLDVGKQIAQNCQGLPLVVDLIAGVMQRREKEKIVWLELLNDLNSFIFNNEEEVMKIIQLSYNQLTDHLKLCFLYLGSYKKDKEIKVSKLKALWSAEGFVEKIEMKSVEEVMEDYLDQLVSSSLVMVSKGVNRENAFQIHDLIHDFCLIKSRKEKMFDLISLSATSSSSLDLMPRQLTFHYDADLLESYKNGVLFNLEKESDSSYNDLLSLKLNGGKMFDHLSSHIHHLSHFRLLRVLTIVIGNIDEGDYLLNEIAMLVHLRYLKMKAWRIEAFPSSFSNLRNLETLVVDNIWRPIALDPVIWNLAMLRHVEIWECCLHDLGIDEPILLVEDSKLENLRILERLLISSSVGLEVISKRFPHLQKLICEVTKFWDSSMMCNWFPQFGFFNELEQLSVSGIGCGVPPNYIMSFEVKHQSDLSFFPESLRSLKLSFGFVTSESLSTIARLPNLEELFLRSVHIKGNKWNMRDDDTFGNLKFLEMEHVSISLWQVGEELFPTLENLILRNCEKLKEIPPCFGDIHSLKSIELIDSSQLEESALKIKEYVEEMTGDDKLQVLVRKSSEDLYAV